MVEKICGKGEFWAVVCYLYYTLRYLLRSVTDHWSQFLRDRTYQLSTTAATQTDRISIPYGAIDIRLLLLLLLLLQMRHRRHGRRFHLPQQIFQMHGPTKTCSRNENEMMMMMRATRNSADADKPRDAFRGQSRSPNMLPFRMIGMISY